jgi:16S rRNA C1402 N4-methylase RsmH
MAVNDELGELDQVLAALPRLLRTGGRAAVIAFHSLEDRKVKDASHARGPLPVPRAPGLRLRCQGAFRVLTAARSGLGGGAGTQSRSRGATAGSGKVS